MSRRLKLAKEWILGDGIGSGGFGRVFVAQSPGEPAAVAKLVPKTPGAERELLFVDVVGVRNVVPVIDSGETDGSWVLVMPRAKMSLRDRIARVGGPFDVDLALKVVSDIATALVDLAAKGVVHRDLKPENVLLVGDSWCLADFGISRYAEAATAPDTRKYALSPIYAAPERWRAQRATTATDVYSLGVIAYELLSGSRPFEGPNMDDLRDQHLHARPAPIANTPAMLQGLIAECLNKSPEARPTASSLLSRIGRLNQKALGAGIAKLREAHLREAARRDELGRGESEHKSAGERRSALTSDANVGLHRIARALQEAVMQAAPSAVLTIGRQGGWSLRLNQGELQFSPAAGVEPNPWNASAGWSGSPKFDVVSSATISIWIPPDRSGYEGRSHSLWYCDARQEGSYHWFETAFMISPLVPMRGRQDPFALEPGEDSAKALGPGLSEFQVAWPFSSVTLGEADEFVDRWSAWFADASEGKLTHPRAMPEHPVEGSWRRS